MNFFNKNDKFEFQAHITVEKLDNIADYIKLC